MPVVGQEDPRGQQEAVFLAALMNHSRQTGKFGREEHPPSRKEPADDKEKAVR